MIDEKIGITIGLEMETDFFGNTINGLPDSRQTHTLNEKPVIWAIF